MPLKTAALLVLLVVAMTPRQAPVSGLDLGNFDPKVRPQDDLYRAANGLWLARTSIPPDRVTYGAFLELADKVEADLRAVIEGVAADRDHQRGTARQIADLYASLMNQARAEELGLQPIAALLQRIDAVDTPRDLASEARLVIKLGRPFATSSAPAISTSEYEAQGACLSRTRTASG